MAKDFTDDDDALLAELGVENEPRKSGGRTQREERIIAGFEEIQRFAEQHSRAPQHGEDLDIFERLYAVRLDRLRAQKDCWTLLEPLDYQKLLVGPPPSPVDDLDDDALLAELGVSAAPAGDIGALRHVRSVAEKRAAEDIANRERCVDFERFKPLFDQVQADLSGGLRESRPFRDDASMGTGDWFILAGQKAYIAEEGEEFISDYGRKDRRLRVIFDNGTEASMLKRSLERALQKDPAGRRITNPVAGPLFAGQGEDGDEASGTIYVVRSHSNHAVVSAHRDVLHKIGVTGGDLERRLANAKLDPTFLMADVEIVAKYELFNVSRVRLENLIHRVFGPAQLDITINDRFGQPVVPREWFLVPLFVIDEAIDKIRDGSIIQFVYDPARAALVDRSSGATIVQATE